MKKINKNHLQMYVPNKSYEKLTELPIISTSNKYPEIGNSIEFKNEVSLVQSQEILRLGQPLYKRSIAILLLFLLFVLVIFSVYFLRFLFSPEKKNKPKTPDVTPIIIPDINYACLIDAGSTSSKEFIFKWQSSYEKNFIPEIILVKNNAIKPPLASLKEKMDIQNHTKQLLDYCEKEINIISNNTFNIQKTPFYLKATAGMRSLSENEQNQIIDVVRDSIQESHFLFLKKEWARVITGNEEGIYGWISVNYLTKSLSENNNLNMIKNTYGVMDLGGSSLEITFLSNSTSKSGSFYEIDIGKLNYSLYTYSFSHYGQNEMFKKITIDLIENNEKNDNLIIPHPCMFKNYNESFYYNNTNYYFYGLGDFEKCGEIAKKQINKKECLEENCSMEGVYQPKIEKDLKFYAISGFAYLGEYLKLNKTEYYSAKDVLNATRKLCQKEVEEIKKEYGENLEYSKIYCFSGNYIYYMFVDGFGFEENWKNIIFSNQINGEDASSWSLGAMVHEKSFLDFRRRL